MDKSFVIERYSNKKRLKRYVIKAKKGFFKEEEILVKQYVKPYNKVLVVGCGTGREIFGLKNMGINKVIGIDISADMIREAKKLLPDIKFIVSDINEFESKEKFDVIILFNNILEQIPSFLDRKRAILKSAQLLKKGGIILLSTHSCFFYEKTPFEMIKNLFFYLLFKLHLKKDSPFEYVNKKEKIYASYSNPLVIKKIIKKFFKIRYINSKKFILEGKQSRFFYIFDEPIYYIGELK